MFKTKEETFNKENVIPNTNKEITFQENGKTNETTIIPNDIHLLTEKQQEYIDKLTKLTKEDQEAINISLTIGDDINILKKCNPEKIIEDIPLTKLMEIYKIDHNDDFK